MPPGFEKVNGTAALLHARQDKFAAAAVEALAARMGVGDGNLSSDARDLQFAKLQQIAEHRLELAGVRTQGMDDEEIARTALRGDGNELSMRAASGSSSARPGDFPNLLSNLAGKILEPAPDYAGSTYREWATQIGSVADFKPKTLVATGEFGELPVVPDGDDFEDGTIPAEHASWIAVEQFGDEWKLTPAMIVNDELDAFVEAIEDKNAAHELTLNRLCVNLLVGNPVLPDGFPLFDDANHGNDIVSGSAPDTIELATMRLKLRKQTGYSGLRKLNQNLTHLVVPEDLETVTEQLLVNLQVVPNVTSNVNTFRNRVTWSVEPMLGESSSKKYYGFATPKLARAIVYVHQRGFERMKVLSYFNPKNGCRIWQFQGRMAAAVRNFHGVVRNAGE